MSKVILISGGTASGKTTIARELKETMNEDSSSTLIHMDNYYIPRELNEKQFKDGEIDWDDPKSLDWEMLRRDLKQLLNGEEVVKELWDFSTNNYSKETITFRPRDYIIVEGIFGLNEKIVNLGDFKIFVEASDEVRKQRRLERDRRERYEITDAEFEKEWNTLLKPGHDKFIRPTKSNADFILDTEVIKKKYISETMRQMLETVFKTK